MDFDSRSTGAPDFRVSSALANKFFPPRLNAEVHLRRPRLLRLVRDHGRNRKALLLEAQAGQGKSILAAQLAEDTGADYCWYQLGLEDGDTLLLISSLITGLAERLPGFRTPLLERMLATGAASAHEHSRLCSLLLTDLKNHLTQEFYLVFDDIYLLEGSSESLAFIQGLLAGAPPRLRFILTSRYPIAAAVRAMLPAKDVLIINNTMLAFSRQEIADLYNGVLQIPVSHEDLQLLHRLTEGWALGLILAGQTLPAKRGKDGQNFGSELPEFIQGESLDYFLLQFFAQFPENLQRSLLILSLLDSMPVNLCELLLDFPDALGLLPDLHRRNLFIRPLDEKSTEFVFHHLLHQSLRALARSRLRPEDIEAVLRKAANWFLAQNRPIEAFGHLVEIKDFAAAEQVMKNVGFELQANNRIITLHQNLRRIPDETIQHYGWLSYFAGIADIDVNPPEALCSFENARRHFTQDNDELGELLSVIQLISYHVMIDGQHHLGSLHLERAAALFTRKAAILPAPHRAHAANVFLMAFTIIRNEIRRADDYFDLGLTIARELGLKNLEAEARLWRCYRHIFAGVLAEVPGEIENAYRLVSSPLIAPIRKGALYLAFVNCLANLGDHGAFAYHRDRLRQMLGPELVDGSVFGAFMLLWEIDLALARDDERRAQEILAQTLIADFTGGGAHLRSQYLYYYAILLCRTGKDDEALAALSESQRLRAEIGSPFFSAKWHMFAGAVHTKQGRLEEAVQTYGQGLTILERMGECFVRAGIHAYRAVTFLHMKEPNSARLDIEACLDLLHRYKHEHFYGWTPDLMKQVLSTAIREGIRPDFARQLAARRLSVGLLADGTVIPLLQIRTLGVLEFVLHGRVVLRGGDLTPGQRQMLAALLTSAGLQGTQEEIAAILWPESPEDKARKNFDTLLTRLRKTLQGISNSALDSRHYLNLRKGVLALEHCAVDALQFRDGVSRALRHLRKGENWQADNAFRAALGLWQGEFLASMHLPSSAQALRQDLVALYLESACGWSRLLVSDGRHEEARQVAETALRLDPVHEELIHILYGAIVALGKPARARKVVEDYAAALRNEQFSEEEIEDIIESFWTQRR